MMRGKLNKKYLLYFLVLLACVIKLLKIEYLLGISIDFSSIIIFIVLFIYGFKESIVTAFIICGLDLIVNGYLYYQLITLLEVVTISLYSVKKNTKSILQIDIIFWIIIITFSMILNITLNYFEVGFVINYASLLLISINALFNVLVVQIIYVSFIQEAFSKVKVKVSLREITFYVLFSAILIPFIINMLLDVKSSYQTISDGATTSAHEIYERLNEDLNSWSERQVLNFKLNSTIETETMRETIENISKHKNYNVKIVDKSGEVLLSVINSNGGIKENKDYDKKDITNSLYEILPKGKQFVDYNSRWINGYFIYECEFNPLDLVLVVEIPLVIYKDRIAAEYMSQIKFLILFCICVFILGQVIKKTMISHMNLICENSENVVNILQESTDVVWPKSNIAEVGILSDNIKNMIYSLQENFHEISETQSQLYKLAYFDGLTKLPNRVFFKEYLKECISDKKNLFAVMFIDLNKFKTINDTMGHDIGDKLLIQVGRRLKNLQTDRYKVFRLGGDEFVIVTFLTEKDEATRIAEKTLEIFNKEFRVDKEIQLKITGSIGVSVFPEDSKDVDTLIKYADMAMYEAKKNRNGCVQLFNIRLKTEFYENAAIEKEIRYAIENNELRLCFQPKVLAKTGEINSIEVLLRWTNSKLGVVPPGKFIPVAEDSEIILDIDKWVIKEAIKENKRMQEEGFKKVPFSVNISAKNFLSYDIADYIGTVLNEENLEPKYLTIEITEGTLISNVEMVIDIVNSLKKLGVRVSMDDLGKGYSSLSILTFLPIDEVKIDMEFVKGISSNTKKQKVVNLIVELAHELKFNVVAEGVETQEEKDFLQNINCDELQGYYFSKPVEINKLKNIFMQEGVRERNE